MDQGVLRIALGDREVVVRSGDPDVMRALERMFAMMRAPPDGRKVIGELEIVRENGCYALRGDPAMNFRNSSLPDVVRRVHYASVRLLIDARPDLLWFHAGVAAHSGRAVLFPGPRGGGKSTLVTHLCTRGWVYLSDEIAPLDPLSHAVVPFPQAPAVRAYPGREMPPEWLRKADKTELELRPDARCSESLPVAAIVRLSYRPDTRADLTDCSPATIALHLLEQSWNVPSRREAAVGYVCALSQRVPGFSLSFSDGEFAAEVVTLALDDRV
jgi:hypothetical protein